MVAGQPGGRGRAAGGGLAKLKPLCAPPPTCCAAVGGKIVGVFAMLSGIMIIALPVTVISSNFQRISETFADEVRHYVPPGLPLTPCTTALRHLRPVARAPAGTR